MTISIVIAIMSSVNRHNSLLNSISIVSLPSCSKIYLKVWQRVEHAYKIMLSCGF